MITYFGALKECGGRAIFILRLGCRTDRDACGGREGHFHKEMVL